MNKNLRLLVILIALAAGAGVMWSLNGGSDARPLANFEITDTLAITKFVIQDSDNNRAVLERDPNNKYWDLNQTYKAREDAVNLILKTVNRIRVK